MGSFSQLTHNKTNKALSPEDSTLLSHLASTPRSKIDYKDISNVTANTFANKSGLADLFKPIKQQVTLRLDGDVLAWAKHRGSGYQSRINAALRKVMMEEIAGKGK